ncbi:hypothetical protein L1987_64870 [Smallanthus sonchifolius]|uniref:Uncharacterized protein n=1 Tax=Smallanthus sonchifolius TaxID=185202 RepID=A0ACB9BSZ8_9ASTR|nr:hypothetical protein L1987_64870 [Smallanthus sonchifolius]
MHGTSEWATGDGLLGMTQSPPMLDAIVSPVLDVAFSSGPATMHVGDVNILGESHNSMELVHKLGPMQDHVATVVLGDSDDHVIGVVQDGMDQNMENGLDLGVQISNATKPTTNRPTPHFRCNSMHQFMVDEVDQLQLPMEPAIMAPPIATKKGKEIMTDGFIKVVKKKKKSNAPKPGVQIPRLKVSKPGPCKPLGRSRPNVVGGPSIKAQNTNVLVSNPFSSLDDTTHTDDSFPELNVTLKKFVKRYVNTNTVHDPDVFGTWSTDLKDYYYSLTKDDVEEVESETDGMARLMSTGVP